MNVPTNVSPEQLEGVKSPIGTFNRNPAPIKSPALGPDASSVLSQQLPVQDKFDFSARGGYMNIIANGAADFISSYNRRQQEAKFQRLLMQGTKMATDFENQAAQSLGEGVRGYLPPKELFTDANGTFDAFEWAKRATIGVTEYAKKMDKEAELKKQQGINLTGVQAAIGQPTREKAYGAAYEATKGAEMGQEASKVFGSIPTKMDVWDYDTKLKEARLKAGQKGDDDALKQLKAAEQFHTTAISQANGATAQIDKAAKIVEDLNKKVALYDEQESQLNQEATYATNPEDKKANAEAIKALNAKRESDKKALSKAEQDVVNWQEKELKFNDKAALEEEAMRALLEVPGITYPQARAKAEKDRKTIPETNPEGLNFKGTKVRDVIGGMQGNQ